MAAAMLDLMPPPPRPPKLVLRPYSCWPHCAFERVTVDDIERGDLAFKLTDAMRECIARPDVAAIRCTGCGCIRLVCMHAACSFVSVLRSDEFGATASCSGMTQHVGRAHPAADAVDGVHECVHGCGTRFQCNRQRLSEQAALHERSRFCQTLDTVPYKLPRSATDEDRQNVCENVVRIMRLLKPRAFSLLRDQATLIALAAGPRSRVRLPVEIWTMIAREYVWPAHNLAP
jgi:hypothetical protein